MLPDRREVHVWFVELATDASALEACSRCLSVEEKERAARFCFEHLKSAYTLSRGVLRVLLGRYLAIRPDLVQFSYGMRGKPRIAFPETRLEFTLAHSGTLAAYACAVGCELGVDIEQVRPTREQEGIVRRYFSHEEYDEWLSLGAALRDEAFFNCWTRKEAYIKALGEGLARPLDSFRVSLSPGAPAMLLSDAADPAAPGRWSLVELRPADGYVGALAVPGRGRDVRILPRSTAAEVMESAGNPDSTAAPS